MDGPLLGFGSRWGWGEKVGVVVSGRACLVLI